MIASATFSSHPVDGPEARRIADDYNQRLKRQLGLRASLPEPAEGSWRLDDEPGPPLALEIGGLPVPGGVGVGAALRF